MSLKTPQMPVTKHDLVGRKVILRSNEDEPYMVGSIVDYQETPGGNNIPIVKDDKTGEQVIAMCIVLPYTDSLAEMLDKLSHQKQCEICFNLVHFIQVNKQRNTRYLVQMQNQLKDAQMWLDDIKPLLPSSKNKLKQSKRFIQATIVTIQEKIKFS